MTSKPKIVRPQVVLWVDRRNQKVQRRFTFTMDQVPEEYRVSLGAAWIWVKNHLSTKYGIPQKHIAWKQLYQGYPEVNGRKCSILKKKKCGRK